MQELYNNTHKYNLLNQIVLIEDEIIDESYKPKVETTKNSKKFIKFFFLKT